MNNIQLVVGSLLGEPIVNPANIELRLLVDVLEGHRGDFIIKGFTSYILFSAHLLLILL